MDLIHNGCLLIPRVSPVSSSPPLIREVWIYLMCNARFKDDGNLKRGQLLTTYEKVQEGLSWCVGWRKETYKKKQCRKAIYFLRDQKIIETKPSKFGLIITINNYEYYQSFKNYVENKPSKINEGTHEGAHEGAPWRAPSNQSCGHPENSKINNNNSDIDGVLKLRKDNFSFHERTHEGAHEGAPERAPLINKRTNVTKETNENKKNIYVLPNLKKSKKEKQNNSYPEDFNIFWDKYPNKKSKRKAFEAWNKLKQREELPELKTLLTAIEQQEKERKHNEKYNLWSPSWKHPATWLNAEAWEDLPEPCQKQEQERDYDAFVEELRRKSGYYET